MLRRPPYARVVTRHFAVRRITLLVGMLAAVQFVLTAFTLVMPARVMFGVWLVAAVVVGLATVRIERYKVRRSGWEPR